MSDQIPLAAKVYPGLPELPINDQALAKFTIEMVGRLHDLEQRFAERRVHPKLNFGESRGASRRPR
jgi:hypothetical protein